MPVSQTDFPKQLLLLSWQSLWACWVTWLSPGPWFCLFRLLWILSMGNRARFLRPPAPPLSCTSLCLFTGGRLSWAIAFFLSTSPCHLTLSKTNTLMHSSIPFPRSTREYLWVIAEQLCPASGEKKGCTAERGDFHVWKQGLVHDVRSGTWWLF